jgi:hypothetical protein
MVDFPKLGARFNTPRFSNSNTRARLHPSRFENRDGGLPLALRGQVHPSGLLRCRG